MAFDRAFELANEALDGTYPDESEIWLYKEIRVEALRSLGAIMRNDPELAREASEKFLKANFFSVLDNTKLRDRALFSDGYTAMVRYFNFENQAEALEYGFKAHREFSESLSVNPEFYACLVRMGLLEYKLGYLPHASRRLERAKVFFSNRGLLTDLEYLNSILL